MENWFCKAEPNCCLDGPLGTKINLTYAADMGNTWCYSGFPEYANMSMVSKSEPATATTLMGSPVPFATNFVPSIPMTINNVSFANPTNYSYYDYKSGNVQPTGFDYQSGYVQPTGVPVPNFAESGQSKPSRPVPAPFTGPKCWISVGDRLEKAKALGDGLRCVTYNMLNANDGKMYYTASQISNATAVAMARFPRFFKDLAYCSGDYCNGLECISGDSKNNTKRGYPLGSYCVSYTSATNSAMYGGATKAEYDAMVANPTVYKNLKSCQTNNCIDPVAPAPESESSTTAAAIPSPSPGLDCYVGLNTAISLSFVPNATYCVHYDIEIFFSKQKKYSGATAAELATYQADKTKYTNLFFCFFAGCNFFGSNSTNTVPPYVAPSTTSLPTVATIFPSPSPSVALAPSPSPVIAGLNCYVGLNTAISLTFVVNATSCVHYEMTIFFNTQMKYGGATVAEVATFQAAPTTYKKLYVCSSAGCNFAGSSSSNTVAPASSTSVVVVAPSPSPSPVIAGLNCYVGLNTAISLTFVVNATSCVHYEMTIFFNTQMKYGGATAAEVATFQAAPTTYKKLYVCSSAGCNFAGSSSSNTVPPVVVTTV